MHEPNGKRQRRATDFVFSRQADLPNPGFSKQTPDPVRRIKQLPQSRSVSVNVQAGHSDGHKPEAESISERKASDKSEGDGQGNGTITTGSQTNRSQTSITSTEVRRFHMSRTAIASASQSTVTSGRVQKRSTIFVERRSRPGSSRGLSDLLDEAITPQKTRATEPDLPVSETRPQKKPGLAARITPNRAQDGTPNSAQTPSLPEGRLPSSLIMPYNITSDQFAAEMQAYTLQEIGHNIAKAEMKSPVPAERSPRKVSKFKPKKPALRYQERHPDEASTQNNGMDVDEPVVYDEEMDDDSEYIIDTYIRMPAQDLDAEAEQNIGLLVLESQPDIDEFYIEESDPEDEENDEEEDENGMFPLNSILHSIR